MKLIGPETYSITYTPTSFSVICPNGRPKFSGLATKKVPKLYIASVSGVPVYVGATRRSMGDRMRGGWSATGANGYHGYQWRHVGSEAKLHIWAQEGVADTSNRDIETVEAEVVYLIRQSGQWPQFQNEIHFHPSNEHHRSLAAEIFDHFPQLATEVR